LAFSPNGQRLVWASGDRSVRISDWETGQELLVLKGHLDDISSLAFSPDGKRLVSASRDGTVKVWDATPLQE
jgi:WD40 repeat protein